MKSLALASSGHWFGISPIARCILAMAPASLRVMGLFSACTALVGLHTGIAHGQPVFPRLYESLEAKVAGAEVVFRGSITNLVRTALPPHGRYDPNVWLRYTMEVRVDEVLKGALPKRVEFTEDTLDSDKRFEQWRDEHTSFLWFVGGTVTSWAPSSSGQYTNVPAARWCNIRLGKSVPDERIHTGPEPTISMDFAQLTEADEILRRARQFTKEQSGPLRIHVFDNTPGMFLVRLAVPIVPSLETTARRLILSPADFLPGAPGGTITNAAARAAWLESAQNGLQLEGLGALRYFQSAENIALVKPFLNHPMAVDMEISSGERIGSLVRKYPLRAAAYEVLQGWGVAVSQPVLEEPLPEVKVKPALDIWTDDNAPASIALDRHDNIYVSNAGNNLVRKLTLAGTNWVVSAIGGTDRGEPTRRTEGRSCGIAVDAVGNVYLVDSFRSILQRFTPLGTNWVVTTLAGRAGFRSSEDGTNSAARFNEPSAIAVDGSGNVFVADSRDATIRKVSPMGTNWVVTTIVGDPSKNASAKIAERVWNPQGLAVDSGGNLFVANEGCNNILKLAPARSEWAMSRIVRGGWGEKYADGMNDAARFQGLDAVALDHAGTLYVADMNFGSSTIRRVAAEGTNWVVTTIAGVARLEQEETKITWSDGLGDAARFYHPRGAAVDSADSIYVADTWNGAVRKLMPEGAAWRVTTIAGHGAPVRESLTR
jgi:sugar lactone lactonase YvrE